MALQDVLGAMKLLIMDQPQLATDPELRAKQLRDLVPGLSLDEASDMAKMPAEGLAIYSRSIYSHQWKMLKSRLPVSYRVLERDWPQVYNEPFSDRILVEALQRQRPWRGNRFETFVGNFRSFILEDYGKLVAHVPYIEDLLCLEYAGFIVRRELLDQRSPREGLSAESLAELKVEELLGLSAWLPHYLRFEQFSYEVLAFKRYFHHNSDTLRVDPPEPLAVFGVCGMDCDLDPAWYFVDREIWEWLKTLPRSSTVSLGELAERYCQIRSVGRCADVELSEEELFLSYLKLIRGLMASGALIVWSGRHV